MGARVQSFEEFWPFYVSQHRHPGNRKLHFAGTSGVWLCLALSLLDSVWWVALAPVAGYGLAWAGHFCFEKNRPATFSYPLWSLRGDFRMYRLTLLGRMGRELERAHRLFPMRSLRSSN